MTDDLTKKARLLVSESVRTLLARHGVTDAHQQLATLMTLMEASHSQVYRKLSGRSSWLEEDLMRIAAHHGETLSQLFQDGADPRMPSGEKEAAWRPARIDVGGVQTSCRVTLAPADATMASNEDTLVLVDTTPVPQVVWRSGLAKDAAVLGHVQQVQLDMGAAPDGGFAVFDDDPDVAESIVDNLLMKGLRAQAFYTTQDLRACASRFDVYIIDWFSSDTSTAADLIEHLRTSHAPQATIVVLTGQIQREHTESDLAHLIHTHDVMVELKPMRVDLLLAKVKHVRQP